MEYKRVISFGDSFTWGSELSDCVTKVHPRDAFFNPDQYLAENQILKDRLLGPYSVQALDGSVKTIYDTYSKLTWPALLAQHLSSEYYCQAWPGTGNQTITRKVFEYLYQYEKTDLLVINWTYISRWDYYKNDPLTFPRDRWETIRPDSNSSVAKFYFEHIHNEPWEKWETLRNIALVVNTLKKHNINFIMTCNDPLAFNNEYYAVDYIINCQQEVEDDIVWFEDKGFYDWAIEHNFPVGDDNGHPLDEAHQAAFEYIRDNYDFTK